MSTESSRTSAQTYGQITADPNPLPADLNFPGTLSWQSNAEKAELYLSRDGGPEKRVSGRATGRFDVKRIQPGIDHVFRLYNLTPRKALLAELRILREVTGRIEAKPNPVPFESPGKTLLTWEAPASVGAEICVATDGGEEQVFHQAVSGSLEVDWLRAGHEYSFRLYSQRTPRQLLDEVTVRLLDTPSPDLLKRLLHTSDGFAKLIADFLPKYVDHKNFPTWFSLWEKSGVHVTPVHFYQPIPDLQNLSDKLWTGAQELPGIDLNDAMQLSLLCDIFPRFQAEYEQIPTHATPDRNVFYLANAHFEGLDSLFAYGMVRHFKPRKIVEVGAGYSTLLLAQAARKNGDTELHSIEPYPADFLKEGIPGLTTLRVQKVEEVELSTFLSLEAGDFLFIDTSHVVKIGGDVNFLLLEVIPRLKPGVFVHLHDIFLPYEYPKEWVVKEHRFWTEQYLLQAFLTFNTEFEVMISAGHLHAHYLEELKGTFPKCAPWAGGSFWMRRKTPASGTGIAPRSI